MSFTPEPNRSPRSPWRISVIIRTLARPELDDALASVAAQTLPAAEVLLVNAGSQPLQATLDRWHGRLPLREVRPTRPLNRPQAANAGLLAATSPWLCFLDDDDFYHPEHLGSLAATLQAHADCRVAYSGFLMLGDGDRPQARLNRPFDHAALHRGNYLQMGAALFARSLVSEGARFDESLLNYQDWDFWLQLAERSRFAHTGQVTLSWRAFRGASGSGLGANADLALQARYTRLVQAKWARALSRLRAMQPPLTDQRLTAA
jgi:glycosyltransferase involved in cell wall biosynthesis